LGISLDFNGTPYWFFIALLHGFLHRILHECSQMPHGIYSPDRPPLNLVKYSIKKVGYLKKSIKKWLSAMSYYKAKSFIKIALIS
jgi:hypothetical protein